MHGKTIRRGSGRWRWPRREYRRCRRGGATAGGGAACTILFLGSAAISAGTRNYKHESPIGAPDCVLEKDRAGLVCK